MSISFIDKVNNIISYLFSSFLGIELLLFLLLFLIVLITNIFVNKRIVKVISLILFMLPVLLMFLYDNYFIISNFENFVMLILSNIYYPTMVVYLFTFFLISIWMGYSIISRSISKFKRIFNYIILLVIYFCYFSVFAISYVEKISLFEKSELYNNEILVSLIQIGNIVLCIYLLFNFFYYLYRFFKRYDKKIEN